MVANYANSMPHVATYWAPGGGPDRYGRKAFDVAPVVVACRWQDEDDLLRDANGREIATSSVVYVDQPVELGGFLARGDFTDEVDSDGLLDPSEVTAAREIRKVSVTPSLSGAEQLTKAWL